MKNFKNVNELLNNDKVATAVKIGAMVCSVVGMVGTALVTSVENKKTLAKLVDSHFNPKN